MAIGTIQSGMWYDANRDMYYPERERYEKEMYLRRQEAEHRRMQGSWYEAPQLHEKLVNAAPKPDLKDPLAFLQNTDKKLLLTGEMQ